MLSQTEILNYLRDNRELFNTRFGVQRIGLFGSYARNQQSESSDVDILIDMKEGVTDIFGKRLDLRDILEQEFHRPVDICHEKAIRPVFRARIQNEVIYA